MRTEEKAKEQSRGVVVVIDSQWGDGGKGKITDLLAAFSDIVVRINGGNNAGHTSCNEHGKFALSSVPSGIFHPNAICIVGSGAILDPVHFAQEYLGLLNKGIPLAECLLAEDVHMALPWHRRRDNLREKFLGEGKIGTTGKGIGPAYADKIDRVGLRLEDLGKLNFETLLRRNLVYQERLIKAMDEEQVGDYFDPEKILEELYIARNIIAPMITNTRKIIGEANDNNKNILGEGGQGVLLDNDLGSWPYVTSSHPGIAGFPFSTGLSFQEIDKVVGVTKAYMTRVGEGPMPTEQNNEMGDYIREKGEEIGVVSGRPRRTGWFDAVITEFGVRMGGTTSVALTKLDILDDLPEIPVCVAYEIEGREYTKLHEISVKTLETVKPVYKYLPGWMKSTREVHYFNDLPFNARKYVEFIESRVKRPINIISVGPHRDATIFR